MGFHVLDTHYSIFFDNVILIPLRGTLTGVGLDVSSWEAKMAQLRS